MMEKYRVSSRRREIVDRITASLEACGVEIINHADARVAPFEYTLKLPTGERLELVCYAFLANKYGQRGRPPDEHRFQVKYGSDFHREHEIFIDPTREVVTLFMGVHVTEKIFIAADPAMHNPTWFSSSVEFKTRHVEQAKATGWYGWERERSDARRQAGREVENCQTEALIAFTPENILKYIQFERIATGLDAGERLLLAEKLGTGQIPNLPALDRDAPGGIVLPADAHPLEVLYGLSAREILDVIGQRFRLGVAVRGGVAEYHLGKFLSTQPEITSVNAIDEDGRPDFSVTYKGRPFLIECKNVLRKAHADGRPRVDFQKTRAARGDWCSRYYEPTAFDVLAACLHPLTEAWEFRFARTTLLDRHDECEGKLSPKVIVDGKRWTGDIRAVLDGHLTR